MKKKLYLINVENVVLIIIIIIQVILNMVFK